MGYLLIFFKTKNSHKVRVSFVKNFTYATATDLSITTCPL
ncbi:hypothetical protein GS03_00435 [Flavobacterium sangjuense]|uniref:Uncharacterized protein n=1 Tax=Flavobacterium sangjuense TaxID=2518177 RepID=A0A4P7PQ99_9FLAO|nr:hypothetical protein GS03_00435 [Flavobacterium sangjuense]